MWSITISKMTHVKRWWSTQTIQIIQNARHLDQCTFKNSTKYVCEWMCACVTHIPLNEITSASSERDRRGRWVRLTVFLVGLVPGRNEALHRGRLRGSVVGPRVAAGQLHPLQELEKTSHQGTFHVVFETVYLFFAYFPFHHIFSHPKSPECCVCSSSNDTLSLRLRTARKIAPVSEIVMNMARLDRC